MKYAGIIKNDLAAGPGIAVTLFTQGCDKHCLNCHNPETWDFNGGKEFTVDTLKEIEEALFANGVERHFSIMGGEPLHEKNLILTELVIKSLKTKFPDLKIYLWTGYTFDQLEEMNNPAIKYILSQLTCLIDGPYIDSLRDISLPMRGSSNQRVFYF